MYFVFLRGFIYSFDDIQVSGLGLIHEYGIKDELKSIELKNINSFKPSNNNS